MIRGPTDNVANRMPGTSLRCCSDTNFAMCSIFRSIDDAKDVVEKNEFNQKAVLRRCTKGECVEAAGPYFAVLGEKFAPILPEGLVLVGGCSGFTSTQFDLVRPPPGAWPNRTWPKNIGLPPDFYEINVAISDALANKLPLRVSEPAPDAVMQTKASKAHSRTLVLATAKVGKWATGWACSIIQCLRMNLLQCSSLVLVALKGGPACDEELVLLVYILENMGFKFAKDEGKEFGKAPNNYYEVWRKSRDGALPLTVKLFVNRAPEDIQLVQFIAPVRSCASAPNLQQVALVSAPAGAIEGINQLLDADFEAAIARATKKGYRPEAYFMESEDANTAYRAYFDMYLASLASQRITPTGQCGYA